MTVTDVRTTLQAVVEAHATHNTWYSVWSVAKDQESEPIYPCVVWDQWTSRLAEDELGALVRTVLVRLAVITSVATDRTQAERDAAVEAADNAAADFILKLRADYEDVLTVGNVSTSTLFDDGSRLETGVLLTFSLTGQGLCLDEDTFNPPADCPTLCELLGSAAWSTIRPCMTEGAIEDAIEDLCEITPPTTVNGTEITGQTVTVTQGGIEVGTVNAATGEVEVPPCEGGGEDATAIMVDSLGTELDTQTVAPGGEVTLIAPDVTILQSDSNPGIPVGTTPAGSTYPLPMSVVQYELDEGGNTVTTAVDTLYIGPTIVPDLIIPARDLLNAADEVVGDRKITLVDLINDTVPTCPVTETPSLCELITEGTSAEVAICVTSSGKRAGVLAELIPTVDDADVLTQIIAPLTVSQDAVVAVTVQLRDSAAGNIGSADVYAPGTTTTKTAPDGSVTIRNSVPTTLHTVAVKSNGTATQDIADSTAVIKNLNGTTIKTEAIPAAVSENITAPIPLKFGWGAGDADTLTWTVTDDEAGTYGTYTQDGGSGTITYSKNGGGFAAVSGAISLAVADTIVVRRTTTTNAGFSRWVP